MNEFLRRILFLPEQRSTIAFELDALHYAVILITMAGATLITLIGGYFLIRYRRRPLDDVRPNPGARSRPPLRLEAAALVFLGVLFLAFWYVGVRQFLRIRVAPEGALDVYVTGKQWMWKFAYPEGPSSISTLYVPAGRPVRLILTSRDVVHSFFVPDFRIKYDAVPGRITTAWFEATRPGAYEILCAEYCGLEHSMMRGEVIALPQADFERWLAGAPEGASPPPAAEAVPRSTDEPSMAFRGQRAAAENGCLRCHTLDGTPHIGPTWAGLYGSRIPVAAGGDVLADEAYITASMMDPMAQIHRGFQPVMPSYLGRISPADTAAIVELIKSLRDVQPQQGAATGPPDFEIRPGASVAPTPPPAPQEKQP
ncbi:MAG: cytochrome c oxidase subunit II [Polyangiaceae bacterium]|nr:cytochrome c oxidase subunit II [Polyangiaceae bacterium]